MKEKIESGQQASVKNIKDYLHLYLPVQVELNNGGSLVYNRIAVACGNMDDEFRYVTLRMNKGKDSFAHAVLFSDNRVKPILRTLPDITDVEIAHLFYLDGGNDGDFIRGEAKDGHYIQVEYSHQGEKLSFLYSMGKLPVKFIPYLLKQGFDLFNLIPENLAIDKTKLNSHV